MADQTARLEAATVKAENGSNILYRFSNDAEATADIPTESGDIPNLKKLIAEIQAEGATAISIATNIFPTTAAGLAATTDQEYFLVASGDPDIIYTVYQNQAGSAVSTGKTAASSEAIFAAVDAATEAADNAQDSANEAIAATARFLPPATADYTTRPDGSSLQLGDSYFNTISSAERVYGSSGWFTPNVDGQTLGPRVDTLEAQVGSLESDVSSLDGRTTTAEGNISSLQSDVSSFHNASDVAKGVATIGRSIQIANTIAELKTLLKTSVSKWAQVYGYFAAGDGGGGLYYRDDSDTATPSNGGSIIVANDGARWKIQDKLNIRPEQFGSVGDWNGSTGTDDSSVFANIAAHMASNSGCVLTIRKRHNVVSGFLLNASNVAVVGIGQAEIHSAGAANQNTFGVFGQSNIYVHGVKFTQPRSLPRANEFAMLFDNTSNIRVTKCKTDGGTAGIWFTHCTDVTVDECVIDTPKADGLHFSHGSSYCKAIGNTVINAGDDCYATTWYDNTTGRPHHIGFYNNHAQGGYWGFAFAVYSADNVEIVGNMGTELALGLVSVNSHVALSGLPSTNVFIANNTAYGTNRVNVVPNMYWFGTPDGSIAGDVGKTCGALLAGNDITFTGNCIVDSSSPAIGAAVRNHVRLFGGVRVRVVNNNLSKCGGTSIAGGTVLLTECSVNANNIDEALDVGIRFAGTPLDVSLSVCNNVVGYGATVPGSPYMIVVTGQGAILTRVCNNTSTGGRGVQVDVNANTTTANNN